MDGRPPTYLSLLNRGQQAHGCVLVSMFIRLQEGTELSILARGDFTEERFDLGNSFLLQKNEQDCPELMAVLFPGAWQDGVGALDLAVWILDSHIALLVCLESQMRNILYSVGSQTLPVISSHPAGRVVPFT